MDLTITLVLDNASCGVEEGPLLLDSPLAAIWHQRNGAAQLLPGQPIIDAELPFHRWEQDGVWGWRVSRAHPQVKAWTSLEIRRKPPIEQFARYTKNNRFHPGIGAHKARDITAPSAWIPTVSWDADVTDPDALMDLLNSLTHLGSHTAAGAGHIASKQIVPGPAGGWRDRPMPTPNGRPQRVRPPYWHHEGRIPCSE